MVARFGGEEFVLVAPDCDLQGALMLAERAREQIQSLAIAYNDIRISITASIGVAAVSSTILEGSTTPMFLLNRADRALYDAKAAGRNAVWAWAPESPRPVWGPLFGSLVA
jgi:diguanylate cyclase (GGDEF)-like protein